MTNDHNFFTPDTVDEQVDQLSQHSMRDHLPRNEQAGASLIGDLKAYYQVEQQEDSASLERARKRVSARLLTESEHSQSTTNPLSTPIPRVPQERIPMMRNHVSDVSRGGNFSRRLSLLVAVLVAALLVGSLAAIFNLSRHLNTTGVPGVQATHAPAGTTTAAGKSVLLQQIHMFNASTGWAMTYDLSNNSRILHTTAGITHWRDVTPATGNRNSIIGGTDFFDPMTAWVAVAVTDNMFVVYRTHDGGQTWQKAQVPDQFVGVSQIFFLNAQAGWILNGKGAATGNEAVDVLHTSDGGATWKILSVTNYNTGNNPTALPFGGHKSGLSFVNETTGWVTGSSNDNFTWLYVTHDGGATWRRQAIPLPANASGVSTFPPVFFNATSGLLPTIIPSLEGQTINIYVTHDGGASWSATGAVPASATARTIAFVDAMHGWIVSNSFDVKSNQYIQSTVYSTSDGGKRWTQHNVTLSADIIVIDFASPSQGWALDSSQFLYQTADGGQTWTKVTPTVV